MPLNPGYALFNSPCFTIYSKLFDPQAFFFKTMPLLQVEILLAENQVDYDHLCCYLKNILIQTLHI